MTYFTLTQCKPNSRNTAGMWSEKLFITSLPQIQCQKDQSFAFKVEMLAHNTTHSLQDKEKDVFSTRKFIQKRIVYIENCS